MGNPLLFEGGEQERGSELCERRRRREVSVDGREAGHTGHCLKIAVCRDKQDVSHDGKITVGTYLSLQVWMKPKCSGNTNSK